MIQRLLEAGNGVILFYVQRFVPYRVGKIRTGKNFIEVPEDGSFCLCHGDRIGNLVKPLCILPALEIGTGGISGRYGKGSAADGAF